MWTGHDEQRLSVLLNGPDNPENCPFSLGDLDRIYSNAWSLGPTRHSPQRHLDSSVFAGLTNVINRQTDIAHPSVAVGRCC